MADMLPIVDCESFNSKLCDELLEREPLSTLYKAQIPIER